MASDKVCNHSCLRWDKHGRDHPSSLPNSAVPNE